MCARAREGKEATHRARAHERERALQSESSECLFQAEITVFAEKNRKKNNVAERMIGGKKDVKRGGKTGGKGDSRHRHILPRSPDVLDVGTENGRRSKSLEREDFSSV